METARKSFTEDTPSFPEVDNIRQDLKALKTDTVELGRHVAKEGREKLSEVAETATSMAKEKEKMLESYIKDNPLRGAAAAFLAGFVISVALRK